MGGKWRILTRRKDFALISTVCIRWSYNFTRSSTMHLKLFRILLTDLQKCFEKIPFTRQSEALFYRKLFFDSLRRRKMYFFQAFFVVGQ